jgi:uncharacterized membrane protein
MAPLIVFLVSFVGLRAVGLAWAPLDAWWPALRGALAALFTLTAAAHFDRMRPDLVRMVPPRLPRPGLWVTVTGVLELLGAAGLALPATARLAAWALFLLLLAMFPANVHAARAGLTLRGRPATALPLRTAIQLVFLAAAAAVGLGG